MAVGPGLYVVIIEDRKPTAHRVIHPTVLRDMLAAFGEHHAPLAEGDKLAIRRIDRAWPARAVADRQAAGAIIFVEKKVGVDRNFGAHRLAKRGRRLAALRALGRPQLNARRA